MAKSRRDFSISIEPDASQLNQALKELSHIKNGAPRALSAAINKTATGVKTDLVRILAQNYTAKQKDIRAVVRVGQKASPSNLQTKVLGRHKAIPLINFSVRPRGVSRSRPKVGVTATVKRGASKKIPWSFIARVGGQIHVAMRVHSKIRVPTRKLFGPSVPDMMDNDGIRETISKLASARLAKNVAHEIERVAKGWGPKT
ncbi:MAG TPA: phage tail protein [Armatimonadota bacterium]|nr:phage tail protein [Armatimonadota bacterium]